MLPNWKEWMTEQGAVQCLRGTEFLLNKMQEIKPQVYLETGCAHLATFKVYQSLLPDDGLAIGMDILKYKEWKTYSGNCKHVLIHGTTLSVTDDPWYRPDDQLSLYHPNTSLKALSLKTHRQVIAALDGRMVDYLFIDGEHSKEGVQADWDLLSPLVRPGGIIAFHDWDEPAAQRLPVPEFDKNGAGHCTLKLRSEGWEINAVPNTSVATAYVYKK